MRELKALFKSIYSIRYYVLLFFVSFIIFLRVWFPDEKVVKGIFDNIKAQTGINIQADNASLSFIPYLGIKFDSAKVKFSDEGKDVVLGNTRIGLSPFSILTFSPKLKINSESFNGSIQLSVSGFSMTGAPVDELYVQLYAAGIQLRDIINPQFSADIFATADINAEGYLNLRNIMFSNLNTEVAITDLKSAPGSSIGFFVLPAFNIKKGELSLQLQKSELTVGRFVIGSAGEDIDGSLRGKWSARNSQYEFTVKLKLAGELEKTVGSFTVFLPQAAKKPDGYYNFRLSGNSRMPVPNISPL